ncbi:hypothetical protein B0I37DRAFT_353837 [Chaetomium sp. MPI-CAGE-AT-0009]|nr:hypothetical protein B0I37DRAFT_353837 [Chaetomium sp. MPI-CAGE-AT-0009]
MKGRKKGCGGPWRPSVTWLAKIAALSPALFPSGLAFLLFVNSNNNDDDSGNGWLMKGAALSALVLLTSAQGLSSASNAVRRFVLNGKESGGKDSPYGKFPLADDPFRFLPCTPSTLPPPLEDSNAEQTWASRFDPNPDHWSWGTPQSRQMAPRDVTHMPGVSGLARVGEPATSSAGKKTERTIVIEPGGPGGSGTSFAWSTAPNITARFTDSKYDVLGWDPRGVNASLPAVACFPKDATRDRWSLLTSLHYAVSGSPRTQLEIADAFNAAMMRSCWEQLGDLPRFLGTGMVARDLEQIRIALGEDELTGYLVSYGTGIGQTYASMFPNSVGRLILDGTEYVKDHRLRGGFGWTALDNTTDAYHDGFLGECINAGPEYCALAKSKDGKPVTLPALEARMDALMASLADRPMPVYLPTTGPSLVTYSAMANTIYGALYNAHSWPAMAQVLYELEDGNATLAAAAVDSGWWFYDPASPCSPTPVKPSDQELGYLVICADAYDAPGPDDLDWWLSLWGNMTTRSWVAGNSRFYVTLPCRHFSQYWPEPVGVYRGDLNHTLNNPVLLIAETYDPATPLRNGRRLLQEMGKNARLIAHHGYGHSSGRDISSCTENIARAYMLNGTLPEEQETACYADEKPYLYGVKQNASTLARREAEDPLGAWKEHLAELSFMNPML